MCLSALVACSDNKLNVVQEVEAPQGGNDAYITGEAQTEEAKRNVSPITGAFALLASVIDKEALRRSKLYQDLRETIATRRALEFERYPQLSPSATLIDSDGNASFGFQIEQTIWDFGQTKAKLAGADVDVEQVLSKLWSERNTSVHYGLRAYVDVSLLELRLGRHNQLLRSLQNLDELLKIRVEGGVSDSGERLRMVVAIQSVQRSIINDKARLRAADAELQRALPVGNHYSPLKKLGGTSHCRREWGPVNIPIVHLAQQELNGALSDEQHLMGRRFPVLTLQAGANLTASGNLKKSIGLHLDASNLLGIGRRHILGAGRAATQGARRKLLQSHEDSAAEFERLKSQYNGYIKSERQLKSIVQSQVDTLDVYKDQVEAGSIPLAEGINFHQEYTDTHLLLLDVQSQIIQNCLEISYNFGLLAESGVENE